jgi:hypothetical protein
MNRGSASSAGRLIDKMKEICKNCQYFDSKDEMFGINTRGLCIRFKDNAGELRKISFVRWVTDTCSDFKAKTLPP